MQADGDYEIGIDYTDSSSNDMNYSSDEYAEKMERQLIDPI